MKIIYADNIRFPSERAHSYQIAQYCYQMAALGHEVVLVTPDRSQEKDAAIYYGFPRQNFTHIALKTGDALRYRWLPQSLAYLVQRYTFLRGLQRWARSQSADIWYTRSPAVIDALAQLSRKWVLEVHDDPTHQTRRWQRVKQQVRLYIPISQGMKAYLLQAGIPNHQLLVAHDGVDKEEVERAPKQQFRSTLGIPEQAFLLVYTGSLYPWKGVDFVVEAWRHAPSHAQLLIVGGPEQDRMRVQRLIPEGVKARVHILPGMARREVFSLLKEADAALLPTSPAFVIGRNYTSPLKLFEYLAAGLPILSSDVPTAHEVLTDRLARFFLTSESAFVEALEALIADTAWRAAAPLEAQHIVKQYTWQMRAKRIADALEQVRTSS